MEGIIRRKDGHIRGASIRVITREGRHSIIERPLQKLFLLEIATNEILEPEEERVSEMNSCETMDRPDEPHRLVKTSKLKLH